MEYDNEASKATLTLSQSWSKNGQEKAHFRISSLKGLSRKPFLDAKLKPETLVRGFL